MKRTLLFALVFLCTMAAGAMAQFPPAGTDDYMAVGRVVLERSGCTPEPIDLNGPVKVQRGNPSDPGDGRDVIDTEILQMSLTGAAPCHGPVIVKVQAAPAPPTNGQIKAQLVAPDYPADSFFDVFVEIELVGLTLVSTQPIQITGILNSIPWIGQTHAGTPPVPLDLYDKVTGNLMGRLHFLSWTPTTVVTCPPGPAFCDSTRFSPCLTICPKSDVVWIATLKDSCGTPVCDTLGTWLDFANCPAHPCPNEEPLWPRVRPDSCDPATGEHFFTIDAGLLDCTVCTPILFVNSAPCATIQAHFFDINGDFCVTTDDFIGQICNDYDCDGVVGTADFSIFSAHLEHCCPGQPCPPGPAFCDSVTTDPCLLVCPLSDEVFKVVVKDSCGNPICDTLGTYLSFANCPAFPCPNEEPLWPIVRPDSCDPATGTHYFTIDASMDVCTICQATLFVNGQPCRNIPAYFFDINGDRCVTDADLIAGAVCNDYNCDGTIDANDVAIHNLHKGHCCSGTPCPPGPPFCDSIVAAPCILVCPKSDVVYPVIVKDSCGNPVCDLTGIWLDFSQCPAQPCLDHEPNWPRVFPDSCDPTTGTHYFTVDAGLLDCTICQVGLFVNGVLCRVIQARFFDINGDLCVTANDFIGQICNDYNCDGTVDAIDRSIFDSHLNHCCCDCKPGDANGTGTYNVLDVTYLLAYLYKGGPAPIPYRICSGDANCNCVVNILDITYLIAYLYKGGPAPCTCAQWVANCGLPLRKQ